MMGSIYIIQDSGDKNFSSLLAMSNDIIVVSNRDCPVFGNHEDHVKNIREKLKYFNAEKDYLVLVGDPINIGLSMHGVLKKGGGVNVLKWDRQTKGYMPIKLDIDLKKEVTNGRDK